MNVESDVSTVERTVHDLRQLDELARDGDADAGPTDNRTEDNLCLRAGDVLRSASWLVPPTSPTGR